MQRQILVSSILLLFALSVNGFQQTPTDAGRSPYTDKQLTMLGLVRSINTIEVSEQSEHGSYATWPTLLQHQADYLNDWLTRFGSAPPAGKETPRYFSDLPEILPGMKLRLNVNADGHGFTVLLEDAQDKNGFAFVGDERGIIRESKYIY
jgi:hypothetical protein